MHLSDSQLGRLAEGYMILKGRVDCNSETIIAIICSVSAILAEVGHDRQQLDNAREQAPTIPARHFRFATSHSTSLANPRGELQQDNKNVRMQNHEDGMALVLAFIELVMSIGRKESKSCFGPLYTMR